MPVRSKLETNGFSEYLERLVQAGKDIDLVADETLAVKSNNATDIVIAPRQATVDNAAVATGLYDLYPLNAPLTISIAQADALTACLVATIR
jgi:hypothetical protein